ncbi:putative bifunctional diguanylate cyclase/phosphodiesterase [Geomonas sp.]|uniref:putative bifunctional diguanylate cyclase/phosphodiesterase n=1 Tax=Geomonas sp. TaxID=2651584 RepID=UPI002B46A3E3|nr:EAL domain-containing protein [Geomonas sp.]HJV34325.1 EAL domain-containing protein [Geomonas sp.]
MRKSELEDPGHILIVDDDAFTRQVFGDALQRAGFQTTASHDGFSAIELASTSLFDVILLDAVMPGMDGFQTCQRLRALPNYEHTPILMVTRLEDTDSIDQAFRMGASDFINKPVSREILVQRMRYMLRASRTFREMGRAEDRIKVLREAVSCLPLGVGITITDTSGRIVYANAREAEMHGYAPGELLGMHASQLGPASRRKPMRPEDVDKMGLWERESLNVRKNGEQFPVRLSSISVTNSAGECLGVVTSCEDITNRRESERIIEQLAFYDTLTGLPNRATLLDRLRKVLAMCSREQRRFAVIFLDLDNFKDINDTLGHDCGDKLLAAVARRLVAETRRFDTVARIGGDEFVVVLNAATDPEEISLAAQRILCSLSQPVEVDGLQLHTNASLGISIYPDDGQDAESLLKCSDAAMYHAKGEGRGTYRFFSETIEEKIKRRVTMKRLLREAIAKDELTLLYQPQWDLRSGRVAGVEALLRWQSADFGSVPPSEFIPVAELSGFIGELGSWVLQSACRQHARWQAAGVGPFRIAVNISGRQLKHPDFLKNVEELIRQTGIRPGALEFEFTETVIMENADTNVDILKSLKRLGVSLSIDDFGTGYSSLSYLKHFPIDRIKIDRSFVTDVHQGRDNATIVKAIISLAHTLKLKVVAEGVENEPQLKSLIESNCDEIQGYYLGMPMRADELSRLVERCQAAEPRTVSRAPSKWLFQPAC